jgi:TolA-binding protein
MDTYPGMNKTQDAFFQKAMALEKGGHKPEAIAAFHDFIKLYPTNDYAPKARAELAKLTPAASQTKAKRSTK